MEDFVEQLARGNVEQVKVVLASVVASLAVYQVLLMAVGYGKLRLPFLASRPASATHRAVGDTIVVVTLVVAFMCISYFGFEDGDSDEETRALLHASAGSALVAALAFKVVVVRWWHRMGRFLPLIGVTVFTLFMVTWVTSAGDYLIGS
ncbi:MAG TPA: DUF6529 family protein [Actinomycetota bacterium]|nr:DUF6529 family protein [Actinomycetota bacterium]